LSKKTAKKQHNKCAEGQSNDKQYILPEVFSIGQNMKCALEEMFLNYASGVYTTHNFKAGMRKRIPVYFFL